MNGHFIECRLWLADISFFDNEILFYLTILKRNIHLMQEGKLLVELERLYQDLRKLHEHNNMLYISVLNQLSELELYGDIVSPSRHLQIESELGDFRKEYRDFKKSIFDPLSASYMGFVNSDIDTSIYIHDR